MTFQTHDGQTIQGNKLKTALNAVATDWTKLAHAIRIENAYADHVTEETKDMNLQNQLAQAERIRQGIEPMGFWLWQRVNEKITGQCVALFSK